VRDNIPYTVYQDAYVNSGVTLTIETGTVVQFQGTATRMFVDGTLVARGTGLSPILFTSDKGVKQPGQWGGMAIHSGATTKTILESCIVEYGTGGLNANIQFEGAPSVLITNCTIRDSLNDGIYCTFSNIQSWPVVSCVSHFLAHRPAIELTSTCLGANSRNS
jgi:hypothetical protein